jgi:hypothetical protein
MEAISSEDTVCLKSGKLKTKGGEDLPEGTAPLTGKFLKRTRGK